jgi:hypothetical protein
MAIEKIDEGVAVDILTALIDKTVHYSSFKEPDIKIRLEIERDMAKQFKMLIGDAHKFLNFTLCCIDYKNDDRH